MIRKTCVVPTAITRSPSLDSRAMLGSGSASGGATGSSVSGSRTDSVDGARPAGASQSFITSSPPSSTTNELCGRSTGSRCEARTSSAGDSRCAQCPRTRCRSPQACAAMPPGQNGPPGSRGLASSVASVTRVQALDPRAHRRALRPARQLVAQREQLARLAADEHAGGRRVADGGQLQALPRRDRETRLALRRAEAARPAVLAGPGTRPVAAGRGHARAPYAGRAP